MGMECDRAINEECNSESIACRCDMPQTSQFAGLVVSMLYLSVPHRYDIGARKITGNGVQLRTGSLAV